MSGDSKQPVRSPARISSSQNPPGRRSSFGGSSEKCYACQKTVYSTERIGVDDKVFHDICFKCGKCSKKLELGTYASVDGQYYCKPHYQELFKLKGNYTEGFGQSGSPLRNSGNPGSSSHSRTSSVGVSGSSGSPLRNSGPGPGNPGNPGTTSSHSRSSSNYGGGGSSGVSGSGGGASVSGSGGASGGSVSGGASGGSVGGGGGASGGSVSGGGSGSPVRISGYQGSSANRFSNSGRIQVQPKQDNRRASQRMLVVQDFPSLKNEIEVMRRTWSDDLFQCVMKGGDQRTIEEVEKQYKTKLEELEGAISKLSINF